MYAQLIAHGVRVRSLVRLKCLNVSDIKDCMGGLCTLGM